MCFFVELETEAKEVFREYLRAMKHQDIERFFNEWKMTFTNDGPFKTEQDLRTLSKKMTKPDDFMVRMALISMSFKITSINKWRNREKKD